MKRIMYFIGSALAGLGGCQRAESVPGNPMTPSGDGQARQGSGQESGRAAAPQDPFDSRRTAMVDQQIRKRGIRDERVLEAMLKVPRHRFVSPDLVDEAYHDGPLPIAHGQTISQPYIVALMTELVRPQPGDRALDVGTGCGYQAAVLAELVDHVYSIEILEPLADEARQRLESLGYRNITAKHGDGYQGWPEHAPFDVIIVAAAPDHIPQPLVDQLAPGGRMVIPVGDSEQALLFITKDLEGKVQTERITGVRFVPMTGEADDK